MRDLFHPLTRPGEMDWIDLILIVLSAVFLTFLLWVTVLGSFKGNSPDVVAPDSQEQTDIKVEVPEHCLVHTFPDGTEVYQECGKIE